MYVQDGPTYRRTSPIYFAHHRVQIHKIWDISLWNRPPWQSIANSFFTSSTVVGRKKMLPLFGSFTGCFFLFFFFLSTYAFCVMYSQWLGGTHNVLESFFFISRRFLMLYFYSSEVFSHHLFNYFFLRHLDFPVHVRQTFRGDRTRPARRLNRTRY